MTVDEWHLRDTARSLAALYAELDHAKHAPRPPREVRVMRPRPGPAAPGNWSFIALDRDLVDRLHEFCRDIANHIEPAKIITWDGKELCTWLAFNANAIADLDFADDLHDELCDQARRIAAKLPPRVQEAQQSEPWQRREVIQQRLARMGLEVSRGQLRTWSQRRKIDTRIGEDGTARYLWSQVAAVLKLQEPDEVS